MKLNNKLYDILKWVSLIALDAIGVAYEGLATVWNLPFGNEIMKTCTITSILIGLEHIRCLVKKISLVCLKIVSEKLWMVILLQVD